MKRLLLLAALACPTWVMAQVYVKDNGVIRIHLNERVARDAGHSPIITNMWIAGRKVVPHDNIGADFQMATRGTGGNLHNPTQGGDCAGYPSVLTGVIPDWNGAQIGTPPGNGILLGIDPLFYNEPGDSGTCLGPGGIAPFDMAFGVTLGDGFAMPREAMMLDMSVRREAGAQPLDRGLSELPVAFVDADFLRYAYYSDDPTPSNGMQFERFYVGTPTGVTHDIRAWPLTDNFYREGRAIALCDRADAVENPAQGTCMAFYAHERTSVYASNRRGALQPLALMSVLGNATVSSYITDMNWHTARRLVAVGHLDSVSAVIMHAERNFPSHTWPRW